MSVTLEKGHFVAHFSSCKRDDVRVPLVLASVVLLSDCWFWDVQCGVGSLLPFSVLPTKKCGAVMKPRRKKKRRQGAALQSAAWASRGIAAGVS